MQPDPSGDLGSPGATNLQQTVARHSGDRPRGRRGARAKTLSKALAGLMRGGGLPSTPRTEAPARQSWWSGSQPGQTASVGPLCPQPILLRRDERASSVSHGLNPPHSPPQGHRWRTHRAWDPARSLLTSLQDSRRCLRHPCVSAAPLTTRSPAAAAVCTPPGWALLASSPLTSPMPWCPHRPRLAAVSPDALMAHTAFAAFMRSANSHNKKKRS